MDSTIPTWIKRAELREFCLTKKCIECMFCYDTCNCNFDNMIEEKLDMYYNIMKEREQYEHSNMSTF